MPSHLPVPAEGDPWARFPLDPRAPANAPLRASDADRDVVHQLLATAYAEGRLDRVELDERTEGVARAKTLGELPGYVTDLVPITSPPMAVPRADLVARAQERYLRERQEALWGFLSASLITWGIWAVIMWGSFPWPIFVSVATAINYLRVLSNRRSFVEDEVKRLEKKERKKLPPGGSA